MKKVVDKAIKGFLFYIDIQMAAYGIGYAMSSGKGYDTTKYRYVDGIRIIYNPSLLLTTGAYTASAAQLVPTGEHAILVDRSFMRLPKHLKKFVIYHELAHIKNDDHKKIEELCGDTLTYNKMRTKGCEQLLEMEFKADAYSADCIGIDNAVKAMYDMLECCPSLFLSKAGKAEWLQRIEKLRNR